jgi:uncharacterized protein YecE (DUF72 family)
VACEPRHPGWFSARAGDLLGRYGISRVAADPSAHPGGDLPGGSRPLIYYRLHGSPRRYYSAYSAQYLSRLVDRLCAPGSTADQVWCIFDNTARHEAWPNARQLLKLLKVSQC